MPNAFVPPAIPAGPRKPAGVACGVGCHDQIRLLEGITCFALWNSWKERSRRMIEDSNGRLEKRLADLVMDWEAFEDFLWRGLRKSLTVRNNIK
jgi:hypothetical protein